MFKCLIVVMLVSLCVVKVSYARNTGCCLVVNDTPTTYFIIDNSQSCAKAYRDTHPGSQFKAQGAATANGCHDGYVKDAIVYPTAADVP
jgi:hypothetical protein